jgi:hypothetical protein
VEQIVEVGENAVENQQDVVEVCFAEKNAMGVCSGRFQMMAALVDVEFEREASVGLRCFAVDAEQLDVLLVAAV